MNTIQTLRNQQLSNGRIAWLGIRPERHVAMLTPLNIELSTYQGIIGDRFNSKRNTTRQVTLIQAEHLAVLASLLDSEPITPEQLRRNVLVQGVNLLALVGREFMLGSARLEGTGRCHPCTRMEITLGKGGYNAMRGHGGITARVIEDGSAAIGESLRSVQV